MNTLRSSGDWIIPTAAVSLVFVMLVPLPSVILDLLLTLSITASVLVLLTAIQILRPVQFSVFPSLILLLTLMRLSLDLASTRRILLHGNEGTSAAGKVIEAFGQFVVGGNYIVGFVIFIALIAIQYLVVSHGAVRTAEVTARFTLDAMPGKQMAIDSDLNTGLINADQARARREAVAREAEFCGSMDGAARFSQRDSLATILIMAINIIAGFLIGVFQQGMPFQEALKTYTILTVGDGLVAIIPALLVSVAGGIVVTRAASENSLGKDIGKQVFNTSRPLWIVGGVLMALALIPGMPKLSFIVLGGLSMFAAWKMKPAVAAEATPDAKAAAAKAAGTPAIDPMDAVLKLDDLMLEVGIGLVPLVDAKQGGQLLSRVKSLRKNLAQQLGFLVPSIHITDNLSLKEREYVIYLRGVEVARWEMKKDRLLAVNSNPKPGDLVGQETREPAFDSPAKWITPDMQAVAIAAGYAVVDHTSVLAAHLSELIKQYAHDLLTRHETKRLVDRLADSHPRLVEELTPKLMSLGEVQKVLQQLLREQVSIRDLGTILEALVEAAAVNKNPVNLVEAARHSLGRALIRPLLNDKGQLKVVTLDRAIEEECARTSGQQMQLSNGGAMQISVARRVLDGLRTMMGDQIAMAPPVLLCSSPGRFYLKRLLEPFIPKIVVISPSEIPPMTQAEAAYKTSADEVNDRNELVMQELSQVYYIAARIRERLPQHVELEDLVNAGVVGLLEASRTFDTTKNAQFKTFAKFRIRGAILDSLRDADWGSRYMRKRGREIAEVTSVLESRLGRHPFDTEIAEEMKIDIDRLRKIMQQLDGLHLTGQQVAVSNDRSDALDVIESAPNLHDPDPFDLCLKGEMRVHLAEAISKLSEREQLIISLYYREELTMKEIAEVVGLALSRVSQILQATMNKLRTSLAHVHERPPSTTQAIAGGHHIGA